MDKRKVFPVGGYAPGNYQNKCAICGDDFIGDKRAVQCLECAIDMLQSRLTECERERDNEMTKFAEWLLMHFTMEENREYELRWFNAVTQFTSEEVVNRYREDEKATQFKQSLKSENNGNEGG